MQSFIKIGVPVLEKSAVKILTLCNFNKDVVRFSVKSTSSNQIHFCVIILIKITQCQDLVTIFLQNRTTDFDETLHVAWAWSGEGFGTSGRSGYSPV